MRLLLTLFALACVPSAFGQSLPLVPRPASLIQTPGKGLLLPPELAVDAPVAWQPHLRIFDKHVQQMTAGKHRLQFGLASEPGLIVRKVDSLKPEEYTLQITEKQIQLEASSLRGLAHATASLLQLVGKAGNQALPAVSIKDKPTTGYRNFMIDMGRNAHSVELLKETIDLLWFYKVDSLHLHLTDDQRFAWPSKAFPKLWDGIITREEFRELEAYAVARGVTIIPELEVPGHSGKLCSNYPEVFGKNGTDVATSPKALKGIKTLLDEMMDVFASTPYIHIGGDEAYGVPVEAQRSLINTLHEYLKSKGRQTIVWEGPHVGKGDNKVNTDVIHINWRTIAYRADEMLKDGYRVVNAAWDPLYIVDHYPRINFTMTSPQHIYETLKLTRFKHVNPGIPTFANPIDVEPSERLIGFCMPWWEGREENFFAQNVPRLIPFAEVAWNSNSKRDYTEFSQRVTQTEANRQAAFYPVSIAASDLAVPADGVFHNRTSVKLSATTAGVQPELRYTLDGQNPTVSSNLYTNPIVLDKTTVVRAAAFREGKQIGHNSRLKLTAVQPVSNLALGKPVTSSALSGPPFSTGRLTDGGTHNLGFYLGYPAEPTPIRVTVDLQSTKMVSRIVVYAYSISNSAEKYSVEVSVDGKAFEQVGSHQERPEKANRPSPQAAVPVEYKFPPRDVRYIRIVTNGNKGYVFDSFSKLVEIQAF